MKLRWYDVEVLGSCIVPVQLSTQDYIRSRDDQTIRPEILEKVSDAYARLYGRFDRLQWSDIRIDPSIN